MKPRSQHDPDDTPRKVVSRVYVHNGCGGETVISGNDFDRLANPFGFGGSTLCCACRRYVRLKDVAWADTGEPISEYRRRLRSSAPLSLKLFGWLFGPVLFMAIGAVVFWLIFIVLLPGWGDRQGERKPFMPFGGAVLGFICSIFAMPPLISWIWGIDYRSVK